MSRSTSPSSLKLVPGCFQLIERWKRIIKEIYGVVRFSGHFHIADPPGRCWAGTWALISHIQMRIVQRHGCEGSGISNKLWRCHLKARSNTSQAFGMLCFTCVAMKVGRNTSAWCISFLDPHEHRTRSQANGTKTRRFISPKPSIVLFKWSMDTLIKLLLFQPSLKSLLHVLWCTHHVHHLCRSSHHPSDSGSPKQQKYHLRLKNFLMFAETLISLRFSKPLAEIPAACSLSTTNLGGTPTALTKSFAPISSVCIQSFTHRVLQKTLVAMPDQGKQTKSAQGQW